MAGLFLFVRTISNSFILGGSIFLVFNVSWSFNGVGYGTIIGTLRPCQRGQPFQFIVRFIVRTMDLRQKPSDEST